MSRKTSIASSIRSALPCPVRQAGLAALLAFVFLAQAEAAESEPRVTTRLSHTEVYEGQTVLYRVTLHNVDDAVEPKLGPMDDFEVTASGPRTFESRQIRIINGQREEVTDRARQYDYRLVPRTTGTLTIPAPSVNVGGQVIKGEARTLKVLPPESQDFVVAEITSDRSTVYPMQPFTITLAVAVKELPKPFADRDPLSVQNSPASLQIPWAADRQLAEGLKPQVEQDRWLGSLRPDSATGFSINGFRRPTVFSLLEEAPMTFTGRVNQIKRRDSKGNEVGYWQYAYPRSFHATKPGTYRFGPVAVQGAFATRHGERGLVGQEIYTIASPVEVVVKDVPEEGRPDTFTGAIGQFTLKADIKPKRVRIGDPMTLTLTLQGQGTFATTRAPDLAAIKEVTDQFQIDATSEENNETNRRFIYSVRPIGADVKQFPSVAMSYFDVESEAYKTLHTDPIGIEVVNADPLSTDQIVASPRALGEQDDLKTRREGTFANITDLAAVRDESVRPERWLLGLGGLAGLYAILAVGIVRFQRLRDDPSLVRRRQAAGRARHRLQTALASLHAGQVREGIDELQAAFTGLVADVADLKEAGLTPRDVHAELEALDVPGELGRRTGRLLEACDAARYGALDQSPENLGHEAQAVLDELIQTLKAKNQFR